MNEHALQSKCNSKLKKLGILYFHDEKGRGAGKRHRAGFPDLMFWTRGKCFAIELKIPGKKPTPEQNKMLMRLGNEGGVIVGWCDSEKGFLDLLKLNGLLV